MNLEDHQQDPWGEFKMDFFPNNIAYIIYLSAFKNESASDDNTVK